MREAFRGISKPIRAGWIQALARETNSHCSVPECSTPFRDLLLVLRAYKPPSNLNIAASRRNSVAKLGLFSQPSVRRYRSVDWKSWIFVLLKLLNMHCCYYYYYCITAYITKEGFLNTARPIQSPLIERSSGNRLGFSLCEMTIDLMTTLHLSYPILRLLLLLLWLQLLFVNLLPFAKDNSSLGRRKFTTVTPPNYCY